ncbi:armadillo repeat-containing protein gudu-like [Schistocerca serialis cubense]|uniref:armadillo repeat-containing protein gudu-like n=1 Tax=Schistocerca serialis cubense TaxID=2023355 RepID=UPI00214EDE05|nr:armadillo repeat-containing protein gudu-like [Schistocerca serialis cubense]
MVSDERGKVDGMRRSVTGLRESVLCTLLFFIHIANRIVSNISVQSIILLYKGQCQSQSRLVFSHFNTVPSCIVQRSNLFNQVIVIGYSKRKKGSKIVLTLRQLADLNQPNLVISYFTIYYTYHYHIHYTYHYRICDKHSVFFFHYFFFMLIKPYRLKWSLLLLLYRRLKFINCFGDYIKLCILHCYRVVLRLKKYTRMIFFSQKLGALLILSKISSSRSIKKSILDFEGVLPLVNILSCPARDLQILAAETIQNIASMRQVRKLVRQYGGIPVLVDLLDINPTALQFPVEALSPEDVKQVEVARNSIKALWTLSVSNRNKKEMLKANCVPLFAKLFRSVHPDIIIPTAGILQECALEKSYQSAFENHGMIADFVQYLFSESAELKKHSASAIFRCAEGDITRNMVRLADGLYILVKLAKTIKVHPDRLLLAAVTGAIWKCALNSENVQRFDELEAVEVLIAILQDEYRELHSFCLVTRNPICRKECFLPEILEVLTNVIGGLSQFAKLSHNREALREARVVPLLVELLFESKEDLLENVAHLLGECAKEKESMSIIEELDGVSLLWSLLKNPSTNVQANAAWALCPCLENSKDAGEMVKSIPGSMLIAIRLLRTSNDTNVLAGVCAVLARIALDKENLAIITDHGVATVLAKHVTTVSVMWFLVSKSSATICCFHVTVACKSTHATHQNQFLESKYVTDKRGKPQEFQ